MDGKFLRIDDECRTSMRGIYAIGDVTGEPMLAHRAMAQGEMVAEIVAGKRRSWDKRGIPAVCFTDPEIVTVGLSPAEARRAAPEIKVGLFPFTANGRAMSRLGEDGFVRVVARADNHLVLGVQAVGKDVSELSTAFGLALEMGARLKDVAETIHAHPTLGEAFKEAALRALDKRCIFRAGLYWTASRGPGLLHRGKDQAFGIFLSLQDFPLRAGQLHTALEPSRPSKSCTRGSSQTATLNRIQGDRSRCGRKTVPGASIRPPCCAVSASAKESSIWGNAPRRTCRPPARRATGVRYVQRRE